MPVPDRLLRTIQKATEYILATPHRKGHLLSLDDAQEVLVVGDLHGHLANFQRLVTAADLSNHPHRHIVFQETIHGPLRYPNQTDKSHQMVDLFSALKCQFPKQAHYLLGNHELAQWTGRIISKSEHDLNSLFIDGVRFAYGAHADAIYQAYLNLFRVSPLAIRCPNRVFLSHSLPVLHKTPKFALTELEREEYTTADLQPGGSIYNLVWGRDTSEENVRSFLDRVDADWLITGHIACKEGYAWPNSRQIIIDCCANPAGYCLIPTSRPLTQEDLRATVRVID